MNRRHFLRNAALLAAGAVAADQLEIVERLGWRRRFFPSADVGDGYVLVSDPDLFDKPTRLRVYGNAGPLWEIANAQLLTLAEPPTRYIDMFGGWTLVRS